MCGWVCASFNLSNKKAKTGHDQFYFGLMPELCETEMGVQEERSKKRHFPSVLRSIPKVLLPKEKQQQKHWRKELLPWGHWRRLCSIWAPIRFVTDHIHFPGLRSEYRVQRKFHINFYFGEFTFTGKALFQIRLVIHRSSLNGRRLLDILGISPHNFKYHFFSSTNHLWFFNLINQSQGLDLFSKYRTILLPRNHPDVCPQSQPVSEGTSTLTPAV